MTPLDHKRSISVQCADADAGFRFGIQNVFAPVDADDAAQAGTDAGATFAPGVDLDRAVLLKDNLTVAGGMIVADAVCFGGIDINIPRS